MNKLFFGIGAVILLYGCFYYNKISTKKKKKDNIDLDEIKNINLDEEKNIKEIEDIVDNIVTNVVAINQKKEKKIKFDDNWVEIESTIEDHNEDIL